jgi:hypothetical protein
VYCLLAGDSRSLEALFKHSPGLFSTLEDYIWVKLMLVSQVPTGGSAAAGGGVGGSSKAAGSYNNPSSSGAGAGEKGCIGMGGFGLAHRFCKLELCLRR